MNKFSFVLAIVLLLAAASAENYTQTYVADGWLKVTRFITSDTGSSCTSVTDSCAATGALLPELLGKQSGPSTAVILTLENIGSERNDIQFTESLAEVPDGAAMAFEPQPAYSDGRSATWTFPSMKTGDEATLKYEYAAKAGASDVAKIPEAEVKTQSSDISLEAPSSVKIGERVFISAKTSDGQPLAGAIVTITYPDGTSQQAKTDEAGTAAFTAGKTGFYTYSIEGYTLSKLASTEAVQPELPPAAAAAVSTDSGMLSALSGALPVLAGIFVIAVVALIVHNFFTSRKEDEYGAAPEPPMQLHEQGAAPQQPAPSPSVIGTTYSQQYTFGAQKSAMAASAPRPMPAPAAPQAAGARAPESRPQGASTSMPPVIVAPNTMNRASAAPRYSETASSDDDVERELAALERQASKEGEGASREDEIENAISELEAIRQKLRERKEQMDTLGRRMESKGGKDDSEDDEDADDVSEEEDEPKAAKKPALSKRVLPPKGKKLKFATHGVRRK